MIKTGMNPSLRHTRRVRKVSWTGLHKELGPFPGGDSVTLKYTKSEDVRVSLDTKHFTVPDIWVPACNLINILGPSSVSAHLRPSSITQRARTSRAASAGLAAPASAAHHVPGPAAYAPPQRPRPLRFNGGGAPATIITTTPGVFSNGLRLSP